MKKVFLAVLITASFSLSCFSSDQLKYTISGISSGGFMANQMATIFSSQFSGVATVAGGFYYCAEDYLPKKVKEDSLGIGTRNLFLFEPAPIDDSFNPFILFSGSNSASWFRPQKGNPIYQSSLCMSSPDKTNLPTDYLKSNAEKNLVDPLINLSEQKVFIYHGSADSVIRAKSQERLKEYYLSVGVLDLNIETITGTGNHNFPTDRTDAMPCKRAGVPYLGACDLDLAGLFLGSFYTDEKKGKLIRSEVNRDHLYIVDQTTQIENVNKSEENWTMAAPSIAPYGYMYASDKCLQNPGSCQTHVALHGCQMSDSFNEEFQKKFQQQVNNYRIVNMRTSKEAIFFSRLPVIEEKVNKYGLLKFALDSGYLEYAEENDLMILFPQTWITEKNYPYNPHGCWDWFGWTGDNYATNQGSETKWLMSFIQAIAANPRSHILTDRPKFDLVEKNFPRKSK